MNFDYVSIGVLLLLFALLTAAVRLLSSRLHGFTARKLFHAGGGLICCYGAIICPTYKEGCAAAFAATIAVIAIRVFSGNREKCFLYSGSDKKSLGDLIFPASVLFLAWITRIDRLSFILPVMIMSVADCAAACVGKKYGTASLAGTDEDKKTFEGSVTFFAVAYTASTLCCTLFSQTESHKVLIISFIIALCLTMVEMFSSRGTDNVLIPVTAYLLITNLVSCGFSSLVLLAAVLLLLFVMSVIADRICITTLYCAARCSVMLFLPLMILKSDIILGAAFLAVAIALSPFINKAPMKSAFGAPLFSIVTASLAAFSGDNELILVVTLIAGNAAVAAVTLQLAEDKNRERSEEYEAVGNAVVARG